MKSRWKSKPRAKSKVADGQVSLIGEIYNLKLKYVPHRATSKTGESVVVLRLPPEATELERIHSHHEAQRLSEETRIALKRDYWHNKARDEFRKQGLAEIVE